MRLEILGDNIYHFVYPNQYLLCSTHIRLQEFFESPFKEIKGKYFTLEQYMDRYAAEYGNFTYFSEWHGMNVPGHVFMKWYHCCVEKSGLGTVDFSDKEFQLIIKAPESFSQTDRNILSKDITNCTISKELTKSINIIWNKNNISTDKLISTITKCCGES